MNPIVFVFLAAVLIGLAFYLVALPLIQHARRNDSYEEVSSEEERLAELLAQRDSAFQALRELSFDHQVGKITDEDFVAFEVGLKQNAAETLRALDRWEAETDDELDSVMEAAIRSRKAALICVPPATDGRVCGKCETPAAAGDRFCAKCGSALPEATTVTVPDRARPSRAPHAGSHTRPATSSAPSAVRRWPRRLHKQFVETPHQVAAPRAERAWNTKQ